MRSHEERFAETKRRIAARQRREQRRRSTITTLSAAAACLVLIVGVSFAMPGMVAGVRPGDFAGYETAASMYGGGADYFTLKGVVDALFEALHAAPEYSRSALPFLHPGRGADITVNGKKIGYLGEIHPDVAEEYGADVRLYAAELDLDALAPECAGVVGFKEFSRYPSVERDLAVVVADGVAAGDMVKAVRKAGAAHLADAEVFDVYRGAQIGEGLKSVAMNFTFSSVERTLTDGFARFMLHYRFQADFCNPAAGKFHGPDP